MVQFGGVHVWLYLKMGMNYLINTVTSSKHQISSITFYTWVNFFCWTDQLQGQTSLKKTTWGSAVKARTARADHDIPTSNAVMPGHVKVLALPTRTSSRCPEIQRQERISKMKSCILGLNP